MRVTREKLEWASGLFESIPAFILGNGPTLPGDLSPLDKLFTIGVNRILMVYDPTILMWYDTNIFKEMRAEFSQCSALKITAYRIAQSRKIVGVRNFGSMEHPHEGLPPNPGYIGVTGSSGVSAAYWARRLGCNPVYTLGMSGVPGETTDFYGDNKYHTDDSLAIVKARTQTLLDNDWVHPLATQDDLNVASDKHRWDKRPKAEYIQLMASIHPEQRAEKAARRAKSIRRPGRTDSDNPVGFCPKCNYVGNFSPIHGQCPDT